MAETEDRRLFKVLTQEEWVRWQDLASRDEPFNGAAIDLSDGYIHFSTAGQVEETVARHFAGQPDLVLVAVDGNALGASLKWEPSRGGDLFPHLYTPLSMDTVLWSKPLPASAGGGHDFPHGWQDLDR